MHLAPTVFAQGPSNGSLTHDGGVPSESLPLVLKQSVHTTPCVAFFK